MRIIASKPYILTELLVLTLLLPAAIHYIPNAIRFLLPTIWLVSFYCATIHRLTTGERVRDRWQRSAVNWATVKPILLYFTLAAIFLAAAVLLLTPQSLFNFPLTRPWFWLLIMFAYPLLSVIPQEIIFRMFFMQRYKHIFASRELMLVASGFAFGLAHLIFMNWVAPLLTAIGGMLFALTYTRHRSLALVCLEHALFGDFLFTIGLGFYFYHGSAGMAHTLPH